MAGTDVPAEDVAVSLCDPAHDTRLLRQWTPEGAATRGIETLINTLPS
ncbi:hypothetical protein [Nonomuraea sp. NPDC049400]